MTYLQFQTTIPGTAFREWDKKSVTSNDLRVKPAMAVYAGMSHSCIYNSCKILQLTVVDTTIVRYHNSQLYV